MKDGEGNVNRKALIDKFCLDYGWIPNEGEVEHLEKFCDSITSTAILRKTLDPSNHPKTETGRVFRPNVATLRSVAEAFINERAAYKRQEAMSSVSPAEDCFYCTAGHVLGIQERMELWSTFVAGRCECKQGDDTGYLARRRPVRPTLEIQGYARDSGLNCPLAADKMVYERNRGYRDQDKMEGR